MKQLRLLLAVAWSLAPAAWAEPCVQDVQRLLLTDAPTSIPYWKYPEPPALKVTAFLPEAFVKEVEEKIGPVNLKFEPSPNLLGIRVTTQRSNGRTAAIVKVDVWPDAQNPKSLVIEHLRLENPLDERTGSALGHSQNAKGLPTNVFRFARDQVFAFAKAGGYEVVKTGGVQNFVVLNLYRKLVGLEPASDLARRSVEHLDKLFIYAKRKLPEAYRAKSADDFSKMIGDVNNGTNSYDVRRIWSEYVSTQQIEAGVTLLKDENEKVLGFIYEPKNRDSGGNRVVFIDPETNEPYHFNRFVQKGCTELSKILKQP